MSSVTFASCSMNSIGMLARKSPGAMKASSRIGGLVVAAAGWR